MPISYLVITVLAAAALPESHRLAFPSAALIVVGAQSRHIEDLAFMIFV